MTTYNGNDMAVIQITTRDTAVKNLENCQEWMWEGIECTDAAQPPRNMNWGPDDLYMLQRCLVRGMVDLRATKRILEWDLPAEHGETVLIPRDILASAMEQIGYATNMINWMLGELNTALDPWHEPLNYRTMERTFVQTIQYVQAVKRDVDQKGPNDP